MPSSFPGGLDSFTNPTGTDTQDAEVGGRTHSEMHGDTFDAIEAIETELGTNPSAGFSTVAARFTAVETDVSTLEATVAGLPGAETYVFDAVAYGAVVDGTTNDTAAWQAAINACAAAGGGIVTSSTPGVSIISGALQDTSGANAQLTLPQVDYVDTESISITIRGPWQPPAVVSVVGATPIPDNHLVLKSTLASGTGAVIGAYGPVGTSANFTNVHLRMENITVRTVANPTNSALDLRRVADVDLDGVVVDAGSYDVDGLTQPTTTTSYGVRLPANNNGAHVRLGQVDVVGFYTGFEFAEHATGTKVAAWGCNTAAEFDATNHASVFLRFMAVHCKYGLKFTGAHAVDVWQFAIEHASSGWNQTTYDIDDASNYGLGFVRWWSVLEGTGPHNSFTVNSATGITTSRVGAAIGSGGGGSTVYVRRDRLVATAGNTVLTLGATPVANSPLVWVNNTIKWPGTDYTISGTVITFGSALSGSDVVLVHYDTLNSSPGSAALSTPGVNIADNFNRANGSLGVTSTGGATWVTPLGTWVVSSNRAAETSSAAQVSRCYVESGVSDATVSVALAVLPGGGGGYLGLYVRQAGATDSGILIQYAVSENTLEIMRRTAGANTSLGSIAHTAIGGDIMSVVMAGSSIIVKMNGVTKLNVTEATYSTNTKHGFWSYPNPGAFDDFSIQS